MSSHVDNKSTHVPQGKSHAQDIELGSRDTHPLGTKPSSSSIGDGKVHQVTTPSPYSNTSDTRKSGKKKYVIIGCVLVAIIIIIGVILAAVFLTGKSGPNKTTPSPTLSNTTHNFTTEEPETTPSESSWSTWSSWGDCDVTCGSGKHFRNRQCLSTNCIGVDAQQESCYVEACPRPVDMYGTWVTWYSWTSCGSTCGESTQSRTRVCNKDADDLDCLGDEAQTRTCNAGLCPDCSKQCPQGTVLSGCTICSCTGTSGSGLVLTESGSPLDLVAVTPVEFDYENLDITHRNGSYTVDDICLGDSLKFEKEGYITRTVSFANPMAIVRLSEIVRLDISQNPVSASRIVGGCVHLSCTANGQPGPSYYEWFHDDILLPTTGNSMRLNNLQKNAAGQYKCRASNDYGSAYSSQATIRVEDKADDFCDTVPMSNIIELPSGCHINGETFVDKGKCAAYACSLGREVDCESSKRPSCGVIAFENQEIQCDGFALPIFIAKQCGCIERKSQSVYLHGKVLSKSDNRPIYKASIIHDGDVVASTNYGGQFVYEIEPGTARLTLLVQDTRGDRPDQTLSLRLPENPPTKLSRVVYMRRKPEAVILSSESTNTVSFKEGNIQSASIAITIPSNAYYTSDGSLFTGQVNAFISTIDTSSSESVLEAPGDFTAISDEGDEQMLESFGMFRIYLEDPSGNPLTLGENITLSFDVPQDLYEDKEIKVWIQDENSRWVYVSDLVPIGDVNKRRKRQFVEGNFRLYNATIRGDTITGKWTNIDQIIDRQSTCFSKVRVYESNKYNENRLIRSAQLRAVIFLENSVATVSTVSYSSYNNNGYCIIHPCNKKDDGISFRYRGYLIADYGNAVMQPSPTTPAGFHADLEYSVLSDGKASVYYNLELSPNGPFYSHDSDKNCNFAKSDKAHFHFYENEELDCDANDFTAVEEDRAGPAPMFWYSATQFSPYEFRRCFMKVVTTRDEKLVINSRSEIGTYSSPDGSVNVGDVTGTRSECTDEHVACMEIRTPGSIYTDWTSNIEAEDSTKVFIYPDTDSIQYLSQVSVDIDQDNGITDIKMDNTKLEVSFLVNGNYNEGTGSKLYCYLSDDNDEAVTYARNKCLLGASNEDPGDGRILEKNWGIRFS